MPLGPKMAPPQGHMFYIGLYREKDETIFLTEATMPRALIFGLKHQLVNLYQVCSNYISGAKNGPAPGVTYYTQAYIGKTLKKSSCLKP